MNRRQRTFVWTAVLVVTAILGSVLVRVLASAESSGTLVPTTRVQRGMIETTVFADGELRTPRTAMIVAPPVNGALQIVHLAPTGSAVKAGEVILEFDPSEQEYNLAQSRSQLEEAEQQIAKAKADAAVQAAQDKVSLLRARFEVRRAELEVGKNELLGEIDARKNVLALNEARRRLAQLEQDVVSRQASNKAGIAVLEQRRQQSRLGMAQAQQSIDSMRIKAPMDGVISIKENMDAADVFFLGMTLPDYREGDQTFPGRFLAEVLDLSQLELSAKVTETDRTKVTPGAAVEVQVDAVPANQYSGKVKTVAGLSSRRPWDVEAVHTFDTTFEISNPDARLRPGKTARVVVRGPSLENRLYLPRQCVFDKDGKAVIYVRDGKGFRAQELKVVSQTESRIVLDGIAEGTEVALLDPTAKNGKTASGAKDKKAGPSGVAQ